MREATRFSSLAMMIGFCRTQLKLWWMRSPLMLAVVFGRRHIIDAEGRRQPRFVLPTNPDASFFSGWPYTQYEVPAGRLSDAEQWSWRQAMGVESSLIRTKDFRRVRYREDMDMPDVEFFIRFAREGNEFVFVPEYVTLIPVSRELHHGKRVQQRQRIVRRLGTANGPQRNRTIQAEAS
jgi:hypothetical protein